MSPGHDEPTTCLAEEQLLEIKHPHSEPTSFTGIREEDGDSRDSGIVDDYHSPLKKTHTPTKTTTRKGLTDRTNTDVPSQEKPSQETFPSRSTKPLIEESPVSSRKPPPRILTRSVVSDDDEDDEQFKVSPDRRKTASPIMHLESSSLLSSFSCAESDIIWTPVKENAVQQPFSPELRTASEGSKRTQVRKRSTESVLSENGLERKRSCAMRTEFFQSTISITEDEVFKDEFSPNASHHSEASMSSSRSMSRCFSRTQSSGQLEMGDVQQKSPNFGQSVDYSLPGVEHPQHESLAFRSISAETLANEIRRLGPEGFNKRYVLVDCRYPYEYDGGHVKCAVNIHDQNELEGVFFPKDQNHPIWSRIPIFYCEFSQKRGPGMALALRSIDRIRNEFNYPKVDYAEMYLLDHGYRKFWNDGCYKSECDPCGYVPMTDSAHVSSLIKYKWHKSKSTSQLVVREKDRMPLRKASLYRYRSLMQVCTEVEATEVVISPSEKTPALVPRRLEFTDSPECSSAD